MHARQPAVLQLDSFADVKCADDAAARSDRRLRESILFCGDHHQRIRRLPAAVARSAVAM
jgi:hypothetical protein